MELRRDLLLAIGVLIMINIAIAFGAIGLFSRMSPAIDRILDQNVESFEAAGDMLMILSETHSHEQTAEQLHRRYAEALGRARQNVGEPNEGALLDQIEKNTAGALRGDPRALRQSIRAIDQLLHINRIAMDRQYHEARRLGLAGIWTVVFVATFSFIIGLITLRQIRMRILDPIGELHDVLSAFQRGDPFRRCHVIHTTSEVRHIFRITNELLDRIAPPSDLVGRRAPDQKQTAHR